jgi:hypothetical protein|tara:strand:+ start:457 stop:648 length:192 start_codon:yes stop_codon:yes gene_type:complete
MVVSPEICGFEELFDVAYLIWRYDEKNSSDIAFHSYRRKLTSGSADLSEPPLLEDIFCPTRWK